MTYAGLSAACPKEKTPMCQCQNGGAVVVCNTSSSSSAPKPTGGTPASKTAAR